MGVDRLRVLGFGLSALVLIVAATFGLDWFVVHTAKQVMGIDTIAIDLRSVHACASNGMCGSVELSNLNGIYPTLATVTLWIGVAFGALVLVQAGARLITGSASEALTKRGYWLGVVALLATGAAGYLFGPEVGAIDATPLGVGVEVERTWAPSLLQLGHVLGIFALHFAVQHSLGDDDVEYQPLAPARVVGSMPIPRPAVAPADAAPAPAVPRTSTRGSRPIPTIPEVCRGKLAYATITAELTRGGIDARCEDGATPLVMWRDVVGAVARRLPAIYDSATFVDVVSTAGATLRILPWTRLTGERPDGDGEARARNLIQLIVAHCPTAKLDRATRAFVDDGEPAAQLPDLELLAQHDARLA